MSDNKIIISNLDANQVIRQSFDDATKALRTLPAGGSLVPDKFDDVKLTYWASGNGAGQIETVTYSLSGSTIATLTLTYDALARLSEVARS